MNRPPLQAVRVIYLALAAGQLLVTGVLFAVRPPASEAPSLGPLLGYVSAGVLLAALGATHVLRAKLAALLRANPDEANEALRQGQLPAAAFQLVLFQGVLMETPALVGALALFFHAPPYLLAVPAVAVAATLWAMPSGGDLKRLANGED